MGEGRDAEMARWGSHNRHSGSTLIRPNGNYIFAGNIYYAVLVYGYLN
jgi:hypothetical protein